MEFPVLLELPLPAPCRKLVTQFLRPGPHPTAILIKRLTFLRKVQIATHPECRGIRLSDGDLLIVVGCDDAMIPFMREWRNYRPITPQLVWTNLYQKNGIKFLTCPKTGKLIRQSHRNYDGVWDAIFE